MRLIQLLVTDDLLDDVLAELDDANVDYAIMEESGERPETTLLQFPVPTEAVDDVLETLREDVGVDDDAYTIVADAETATTEHIDELQEKYTESDEGGDDTLAEVELLTKAKGLNPNTTTYLSMTLFSTVIATAGLLRNSAAAVVGAMVIAPFFGTALSINAGICCEDRSMFVDGLKSQVAGLAVAVVGATAFAWLMRTFSFVPPGVSLTHSTQFSLFMTPSLLSVCVALAAGAAGAFALATALPVALAGVAIAAAITPSAAALGISLAWRDPILAAGALTLLAVNVVAINVAGVAVLWFLGYHPATELASLRSASARHTKTALLAVAVVAAVVLTGAATYNQVTFGQGVNAVVQQTIGEEYERLELASVSTEYRGGLFVPGSETVTVSVVRTSDRDYEGLSRVLERRIAERTGSEVSVQVHFIDYEGARESGGGASNGSGAANGTRQSPTTTGTVTAQSRSSNGSSGS